MVTAPPHAADAARFAATDAQPGVSERTAWAELPAQLLDGGEIIILAIKPSMWRPIFESAAWLVTAAGLAATLTLLARPFPGLSITTTAQVILLIAFTRLAVAVVRWVPTWYVLTNRRIIEVQGVRQPRIAATKLLDVRNTYVSASAIEKPTRLGTITYVTVRDGEPPHYWLSISDPAEVHAQIRRAIENAIDQHAG
jgi:hypothetical protein